MSVESQAGEIFERHLIENLQQWHIEAKVEMERLEAERTACRKTAEDLWSEVETLKAAVAMLQVENSTLTQICLHYRRELGLPEITDDYIDEYRKAQKEGMM